VNREEVYMKSRRSDVQCTDVYPGECSKSRAGEGSKTERKPKGCKILAARLPLSHYEKI
jgi:hypothetical protein